jgi:hypothetical protein
MHVYGRVITKKIIVDLNSSRQIDCHLYLKLLSGYGRLGVLWPLRCILFIYFLEVVVVICIFSQCIS